MNPSTLQEPEAQYLTLTSRFHFWLRSKMNPYNYNNHLREYETPRNIIAQGQNGDIIIQGVQPGVLAQVPDVNDGDELALSDISSIQAPENDSALDSD